MRIAIIGAGIIGVNTALALQDTGADVCLIDRSTPGSGASFGNAGCFATSEAAPISMPGLLKKVPAMLLDPLGPLALRWSYLPQLAPWIFAFLRAGRRSEVERISVALAALLARVDTDYAPRLRDARALDLIRSEGAVFVHSTQKSLLGAKYEWDLKKRRGIQFETLNGPALRDLEPALAANLVGGHYVPNWWHTVDPEAIVQKLHALFLARSVSLAGSTRRAEVAAISESCDGARITFAGGGEEKFDIVVIACGAHSRSFCRALGHDLPLDTERGYNLTLPNPGVVPRRPVCVVSRGYFMTPMAMGLRIGGGVELGGLKAAPDWRRAEAMVADAGQVLPGLNPEGGVRWMGFRPSMPDSLPVIGALPGRPRVFVGFGHGHMGLTFGATTGRMLADLICHRPPVLDPAPYRAERFRRQIF